MASHGQGRKANAALRLSGFLLGLLLAAFEGLALVQARAAPVVATAHVSAIILAPDPVVSVVDTLPAGVNASTGAVVVHVDPALNQAPRGPDSVGAGGPAAVAAAMLSTKAGDGTLRDGGLTVAVTASPRRMALPAPGSPDTVNVLVEFN
jgi:hypothetical protein